MKKLYIFNFLLLCGVINSVLNAQPCSGSPGSNTIIPSTYTVCSGDSVVLTLAASYTNSGIHYQWQSSTTSSVGPFTAIPGATLNAFTSNTLNAIHWFQVAITCSNSGLSTLVTQMINVAPCGTACTGTPAATGIIPASSTLCAGDAASMSLTTNYTNTGIDYQWGIGSSAAGPYTIIPGGILNTYISGALSSNAYYNVVVTCTNSGGTVTATQSIGVVSCTYCVGTPGSNFVLPTSHTVCIGAGASMSLANTYTASGITYQWQSSTVSAAGPFSSIPGATLSSYTSGNLSNNTFYNVVITCTNSGQSNSVAHTVSVLTCTPPCTANANFTLAPTSTPQLWNAIPATTTGITAAQWQWGDGTSSNTLFTSHQYTSAGMYTICLSITVTCGASDMACSSYSIYRSSSDMVQVDVVAPGTVGLAESAISAEDIIVYPNPNNGTFSIRLIGSKSETSFQVTNLLGQIMFESKEQISGPVTKQFDLSHLENGIYFLKVTRGNHTEITRISVRR